VSWQGTLNNWVENQIGQIAIGRNNSLLAGSLRAVQRDAATMSLIHSARLNGHDVYTYPTDVPERRHRNGPPAFANRSHIGDRRSNNAPPLRPGSNRHEEMAALTVRVICVNLPRRQHRFAQRRYSRT
jgi:hypothetical protein